MIDAATVKEAVTVRDFVKFMGLSINRAGFVVCPFHGDNDASLKIYPNDRGWCCFGCHKGGDVINMASAYYGLSFQDTLNRLNEDFGLGLSNNTTQNGSDLLLRAVERAKRKSLQEKEKRLREAAEAEYWCALDEWMELQKKIKELSPKSPDEDFNEEFVLLVAQSDSARDRLENAEERRAWLSYDAKRGC